MDGPNPPASRPGKDGERARGALWALLCVAVGLRLIAWWRSVVLFDDGPIFIYTAEAMAAGNWASVLQHPYHPLYSAGIWLLGAVVGSYESAAVLLSIAAGAAAVALLFGFLRETFGTRTALIGAALLAVHPRAVGFTSDVQSDSLYMALFLAALYLIARRIFAAPSCSPLASLALGASAGVAIGASYLTRPEGVGLALVSGLLGGAMLVTRRWSGREVFVWGAAVAFGLAVAMAPYVLALRAETGEWMLSQKKSASDLVAFAQHDPKQAAERWAARRSHSRPAPRIVTPSTLPRADDPVPAGRDRPAAERVGAALREVLGTAFSSLRYDMLLLVGLGLWACRGVPGPRAWLTGSVAVLYLMVLVALVLNAGYVSRRHVLAPLLPLLGYAAVGVPVLGRAALACWRRLAGGGGGTATALEHTGSARAHSEARPALIGLAILVLLALPSDLAARRVDRLAVRHAAEWLRAQPDGPSTVAAGRLRIAYYAGGRFVPLPSAPKEGMIGYLRARGARYVIIDEAKLDQHQGLRDAQGAGLRLIHRESAGGREAAVFEVEPAG